MIFVPVMPAFSSIFGAPTAQDTGSNFVDKIAELTMNFFVDENS